MSVAICFWALLSLENFEFIYLPSFIKNTAIASGITVGDVLLSHSLLEFIHPEELSLATTDLLNFVRIKTLAGAITRCRLRRIKSLAASDGYKKEDWKVTDVVMYTAANKTILTFFHTHQVEPESYPTPSPYQSPCFYNTPLNQNDASIILQTLQKYSSTIEDPLRLFQIYNTVDKKLVFQWPTKAAVIQRLEEEFNSIPDKERCFDSILQYAINLSIEEIDKQTHVTRSSGTDCTHHSHSNSAAFLEPCGVCQIEKIIITYGSLTFSSFQVTPIDTQFYHQHLNRIPSTSPSTTATTITTSTINNNDKPVTNNSNNYEKFMKSSFLGETSPPLVSLPPISSPTKPSSTTSSTSSTKTTTNTTTERKKSPSSSSKNSNKLTLPKAWKTRFGVTEKKCENCSTNKSPEWRRGPTGHKTLCNACGLRYARLVAKREKKKSKSSDEDDEDFNNKKTKKP